MTHFTSSRCKIRSRFSSYPNHYWLQAFVKPPEALTNVFWLEGDQWITFYIEEEMGMLGNFLWGDSFCDCLFLMMLPRWAAMHPRARPHLLEKPQGHWRAPWLHRWIQAVQEAASALGHILIYGRFTLNQTQIPRCIQSLYIHTRTLPQDTHAMVPGHWFQRGHRTRSVRRALLGAPGGAQSVERLPPV